MAGNPAAGKFFSINFSLSLGLFCPFPDLLQNFFQNGG
jgi:hypothetical protein